MDMSLSIISPTTGKDSLFALIESIIKQKNSIPIVHYLIWDDKREGKFINEMKPDDIGTDIKWGSGYIINNIVLKGKRIKGEALGSSLRAIGLISADSELVTFADDDITWEANHVETMLPMFQTSLWGFCKRRIWTTDNKIECLGVDNFESVGEDAKTPYKMVDNNCMMFRRELGVSAAPLYRETKYYNDDRQMYAFLKQYAGEAGKTNQPTVNQICPERLISFFRTNCTPEKNA